MTDPKTVTVQERVFTNADFMRVMAKLSSRCASKTADLAYGAWNDKFCSADAANDAARFLSTLRLEIEHWESKLNGGRNV